VQEGAPTSTFTSWTNIAAMGTGKTMQVCEDEQGIALHSDQPELAVRAYKEHCASHPLDGRSDQFDENVQVDVTNHAAKCSIETPSIPAHPTLAPALNVVVRIENTKAAVEEKRDAVMLPVQIAQQQGTRDVTQTDMEDQGGGASEVEVGVSITESTPSRS